MIDIRVIRKADIDPEFKDQNLRSDSIGEFYSGVLNTYVKNKTLFVIEICSCNCSDCVGDIVKIPLADIYKTIEYEYKYMSEDNKN